MVYFVPVSDMLGPGTLKQWHMLSNIRLAFSLYHFKTKIE